MAEIITYKTLVVCIALILLWYWQSRHPAVLPPTAGIFNASTSWQDTLCLFYKRHRRHIKHGLLWVINSIVSLLLIIPITEFAAHHHLGLFGDLFRELRNSFPSLFPTFQLVLNILLLDIWIYWWHRCNHRVPLLWRFHAIHHLDQRLDITSAFRFHAGEILISCVARGLVIAIFSIPLSHVILFEALVLIASAFHHSNIALTNKMSRYLSAIIVTPNIHWLHHHVKTADTNSNFATLLSCWDRIFGTQCKSQYQSSIAIDLEGLCDQNLPSLWLLPFRKSRVPCQNKSD